MEINKIYDIDCLEGLKSMPDESVNCCVTSPPYFNLRDYGCDGQIGLENTPEEYIRKLVGVFREVRRVLKEDGTLWINIGDSYIVKKYPEYKNKDLLGIPWMLAFALRADGWYLRQDIIWHKPNAMPENVKDRCTKSHEYVFLFTKSSRYYFDNKAIQQQAKTKENRPPGIVRNRKYNYQSKMNLYPESYLIKESKHHDLEKQDETFIPREKVNKRSVWTIPTKPTKNIHVAAFPEALIIDCIKAGCPEYGLVLDPFMGSGTTAIVARKLERNYIGFELNPEYVKLATERLINKIGVLA